jgi:hypothetical protein
MILGAFAMHRFAPVCILGSKPHICFAVEAQGKGYCFLSMHISQMITALTTITLGTIAVPAGSGSGSNG